MMLDDSQYFFKAFFHPMKKKPAIIHIEKHYFSRHKIHTGFRQFENLNQINSSYISGLKILYSRYAFRPHLTHQCRQIKKGEKAKSSAPFLSGFFG